MILEEHYEHTRCYWCWMIIIRPTASIALYVNHINNPINVREKSTHVYHFIYLHVKKRGLGGIWFLSSSFKKETWCYAISWCAMFVLYTGSGKMLLLMMDSGMEWLSVVFYFFFFCRSSHVMMLWHHGGADDVTLLSLECRWGRRDDNNGCCWM